MRCWWTLDSSFGAIVPMASAMRGRAGEGRSLLLSASTSRRSSYEPRNSSAWREEIEAEVRAVRLAKERITLCRRDIAKMIATGIEESVPTERAGQGPASWQEVHAVFRGLVEGISRTAGLEELEAAADALSSLADDILNLLEVQVKTTNMSANEFSK